LMEYPDFREGNMSERQSTQRERERETERERGAETESKRN